MCPMLPHFLLQPLFTYRDEYNVKQGKAKQANIIQLLPDSDSTEDIKFVVFEYVSSVDVLFAVVDWMLGSSAST